MKLIFTATILIQLFNFSAQSNFEIPFFQENDTVIHHFAYSLSYNSKFKQANWVAYQITKNELVKETERSNKFTADPLISNSNNAKFYKKSGFDRGHLAPAADMSFSEIAMKESFYFSNMSPQTPSFNRGIWKKLEEKTRAWAENYDSLYIVVGPILHDSLCEIGGENGVKVPHHYYKVILDKSKNHRQGIAFLIPNENFKEDLSYFSLSIQQLELISGINFFPTLSPSEQDVLEKGVCYSCW
jgi:endonuclease G